MGEIPEELWKPAVALVVGLLSGGAIGFRFGKKQSIMGSGKLVDQSRAKAGGDVIGGNKKS